MATSANVYRSGKYLSVHRKFNWRDWTILRWWILSLTAKMCVWLDHIGQRFISMKIWGDDMFMSDFKEQILPHPSSIACKKLFVAINETNNFTSEK